MTQDTRLPFEVEADNKRLEADKFHSLHVAAIKARSKALKYEPLDPMTRAKDFPLDKPFYV